MAIKIASDEYKRLKKEVSRMAQIVNKRMQRIEQAQLTFVPEFKKFESQGRPHFGVRGKTYNELQSEYWQLTQYINSKTGTVKQARQYAQTVLDRIGAGDSIKGATVSDMKTYMTNLFEVTGKIQDYLKTTEDKAFALDYQKIWNMVSTYFDTQSVRLEDVRSLSDETKENIIKLMEQYRPVEQGYDGYSYGSSWDWAKV